MATAWGWLCTGGTSCFVLVCYIELFVFYWVGLLAWCFWLIVLDICIVCVRFVVCVGGCWLFWGGCLLAAVAGLICWLIFGGLSWFEVLFYC